ncbi:MAG: hypothetical protein AAF203_07015 [Pseudomonadota bacterium]
MKLKVLVFFLSILLGLGLVSGCSSDTSPDSSQQHSGPTLFGSGDGAGGGNTCNGRPIEDFEMGLADVGPTIDQHPAFIKHIQPILNSFETYKTPDGQIHYNGIYLFLTRSLKNKSWYLIPCPIDPKAAQEIGAVVTTDQGASQTMDAIWFSTPALNGNHETDNLSFARLIVHEMLMAVRLLKFESHYTQCLIQSPAKDCGVKDLRRSGKASDLTDVDYTHIRTATNEFLRFNEATSREEWSNFMARHFQILDYTRFQSTEELVEVDPTKIKEALHYTKHSHSMPAKGYYKPWHGSHEKPHQCNVEMNWNESEKVYDVFMDSENGDQYEFQFSLPKAQEIYSFPNQRTRLLEVTFWANDLATGVKTGELVSHIDIIFDAGFYQLNSIYVKKIYCLEHNAERCTNYSGDHQEIYLCTNQLFDLSKESPDEPFTGM